MSNLQELGRKLQLERLFVRAELDAIQDLNKQIRLRSEQLSHLFWTTRQHHLNLNHFITNSSQGVPALCSKRLNNLDTAKFVDAYKELGYQESLYANFLQAFRSNPTLAAACLAYGDKMGLDNTSQVVQSVVIGIYGNSILSGDYSHLLELMETLILLQLASEDQPRRIIRKGNAPFCIVYKLFTESSIAGRLFLTSALQEPIFQVLMEDELYLERDEKRILDCFSQADIEKKFGKSDDPEFKARIKKHIKWTEDRFFEICKLFVDNLQSAMFCFPKSLAWVVARAYHIIKDAGNVTKNEAKALCADLMIQMFISPAIVTPELYGITGDAPISDFTRFNLMQIAQTLQVLAQEGGDAQRDSSFYSRFEKDCVSSLLDAVINTGHSNEPPSSTLSKHGFKECSMFLTSYQLAQLILLLKTLQHSDVKGVDQTSLSEVLQNLPETHAQNIAQAIAQLETPSEQSLLHNDAIQAIAGQELRKSSASFAHSSPLHSRVGDEPGSDLLPKKFFSKTRGKTIRPMQPANVRRDDVHSDFSSQYSGKTGSGDSSSEDHKASGYNRMPDTVLVISPMGALSNLDPPGMLSENEVLEMENGLERTRQFNLEAGINMQDANHLNDPDSVDNRPRYSHYSTDLSDLGEALSSTSGSSMDDDPAESVPADDTSSFRGTSSHGNQDEDLEMEEGDLESVPHTNNDEVLKALERKLPTSRESIEDKMRKFEIRPQLGVRFGGAVVAGLQEEDRADSGHGATNYFDNRSDTWSTDVCADDSEAVNDRPDPTEPQLDRLQEIAENPARGQRPSTPGAYLALLPRDEDSRSEVWSVEVLPSDSEPPDVKPEDRLQELESESTVGQEDPNYPLEDNRSRASTPGLSAASGVSGTSGASLVSDVMHAKGGDEHGSSSEKSFGKTPSSISPDVDDMLINQSAISVGSSGNKYKGGASNGKRAGTNADSMTHSTNVANIVHDSLIQPISVNLDDDLTKYSPIMSNVVKPVKPVSSTANGLTDNSQMNANNVGGMIDLLGSSTIENSHHETTDVQDDIDDNPRGATLIDSTLHSDNTNTIKRSPYQRHDKTPSNALDLSPTQGDGAASPALDEFLIDPNGLKPMVTDEVKSAVTSQNSSLHTSLSQQDVAAFDPLATSSESAQGAGDTILTDVLGQPLITPQQSRTSEWARSTQTPKRHSIDSNLKNPERKKSWWKPSRIGFAALSTKKKPMKMPNLQQPGHSGSLNGIDFSDGKSPSEKRTSKVIQNSTPATVTTQHEEDIMEKYMRKAASSRDSPKLRQASDERASSSSGSINKLANSNDIDVKEIQNGVNGAEMSPDMLSMDVSFQASASNDNCANAKEQISACASEASPTGTPKNEKNDSRKATPANCPSSEKKPKPNMSQVIADAQRKLRLMLATSASFVESSKPRFSSGLGKLDFNGLLGVANEGSSNHSPSSGSKDEVMLFLKLQLAEAVSLQDHSRIAQIHETTRCLQVLDNRNCKELLQNLWKDYKQRTAYVTYLIRTKQSLLSAFSSIQHALRCTQRDQDTCRRYLTSVFVNLFLKKMDNQLKSFRHQFTRATAADEKVALVRRFLSYLYGQMSKDPVWENAGEEQLRQAERAIERSVFLYIYKLAIFPNGDGDVLRDQLFHEHIHRLGDVVTPQHPALLIPKNYLNECPWMSAQAEAKSLNAYKTPRDKLAAVLRCCNTIMNLLRLADEGNVPGADDFTPVLVFVLIKANPRHLLSTVQYIQSFLGDDLTGEDSYWWMQFTAATEFIKTIDERL